MQWLVTIPPIIIVLVFKIYTTRVFDSKFRFYIPTEEELQAARVHSERADAKGNRLEKRFGHPALHAELFTPMLHAKMMPLLSQVYQGKIGRDQAKLDEYGGQKMEAQVVGDGIKIAAIDQVSILPVIYGDMLISDPERSRIRPRTLPTRPWRTRLGCSFHRLHYLPQW